MIIETALNKSPYATYSLVCDATSDIYYQCASIMSSSC